MVTSSPTEASGLLADRETLGRAVRMRGKEREGGGKRRKEEEGGGRRRKEEEGGGRRKKDGELHPSACSYFKFY